MLRLRNRIPVEPAGFKGSGIVRIRDLLACGFVVEPGKASELFSPAGCNRRGQVFPKIAEKEKRRFAPKFFTHEEQWRRGREQHDFERRANWAGICNLEDSFAERTVSDLIVILEEGNERGERHARRGFTTGFTIFVRGLFALVPESADQAAA